MTLSADTARGYADVLAEILDVPTVPIDAHWFHDLGADSLIMARFCARVRDRAELPDVSMRDVYDTLTATALAARTRPDALGSPPDRADRVPANVRAAAEVEPDPGRAGTAEYLFCAAAQLTIFVAYVVVVGWVASLGYDWVTGASGPLGYYTRSVLAGAVAFAAMSAAPIAAKWLLIGRWREGSIRIWSLGYLRFWTVRTLIRTNPLVLLAVGSPLYTFYLRALGARIGTGVVILSRNVPIATDLLTIGDDTVVRKDAIVLGYRARSGRVEIGPVTLGRDVLVSESTVVDIGSSMGEGSSLGHQSSLHGGQHVPSGETWAGSPAERSTMDIRLDGPHANRRLRRIRYSVAQLFFLLAVYLPLFVGGADVLLSMFPTVEALAFDDISLTSAAFYVEALEISAVWFFGVFFGGLVVVAVVPRLLSPAVEVGKIYPLYGFHYTAARTIARLTSVKYYLYLFGDSSYVLGYLRWVGYRMRRVAQTGSNFGTAVKHENPFATTVGSGTMVADGLSIMNAEYNAVSFRVSPVRIPADSFIGNRIVYPPNGRIGENCLLATKVMVPVDGAVRSGVGLLGSPSFEIPRTVERDHRFDHWTRGVELHRRLVSKNRHNRRSMALAVLARWAYFFGVTVLTTVTALQIPRFGALAFAGQALGFLIFTTLWFVVLERAGARFRRLRPQFCSIYHPDFWRHERYWKFVVPDWDRTLGGTPWKNLVSRMLGVTMGRRVFDDGCSITERTLVTLGDDVTLNGHSVIQCHSQEDGTFKSDRVTIDDRSTLGLAAFVHYGTTIGTDARLSPDSFLMKGEQVPPGTVWAGNPAMQVADGRDATERFWRGVIDRGGVTAVPRWSLPSAPVGVDSTSVELPRALSDVALSTRTAERTVLLAAHCAVLAAITRQSYVSTAYHVESVGETVPFAVDTADATWRELIHRVDLTRERAERFSKHTVDAGPVTDAAFDGDDTMPTVPGGAVLVLGHSGNTLRLRFRTEALNASAAARIAGYHHTALTLMSTDPDTDLAASTLLSPAELELQLGGMAGESKALPDKRVHQLIEERVDLSPDAVAATSGEESWTYRRLDAAANRIAAGLRAFDVESGDVVAVATERTLGWLATVLAVFKVGAVYLPVEPHFPTDRIASTLERAECRVVAVEGRGSSTVREAVVRVGAATVCIDAATLPPSESELEQWAALRPDVAVSADGPAYIYFTSGSTGLPKGAMCEHAGMVNHILAKIDDLDIADGAVVAQTAPQCFDISLWQLLAGLMVGGRTVLIPQDVILDVERFVDTLGSAEVAVLQVVPSYLDVVLTYLESAPRALPHLRCVSVTGEAVKKDLTRRFFSVTTGITMVNAYGLTETSDDTNHEVMHDVPERDRVPLGRPIRNVRIYLVDDALAPVPLGSHGEIVFSGVCVGRGYVNDPERSALAFLDDPHRPGERLYRSGDLGRWLPEGKLDFLGRRDTQVKIRGYRIEIGEIDNALLHVPGIRDGAVVVAESPDGGAHLVAFYTATEPIAPDYVRSRLSDTLPHYMVPAALHPCDTLPLTANSKIDRKVLTVRATELLGADRRTEAASGVEHSPSQRRIAEVWARILGGDASRFEPTDSFFDRGGTSLSAVKLAIALGDGITLADIKECATLADLSALVSAPASTNGAAT
ncbi:hypothetical protein GCM10007304_29570 [Rhodococcoides trifolii]|uniref:Carrier domain-containing protein n=1 Tax=Rhodococcoides trifolii TaxID=908250 RepID=A0A917FXV1_9NOCA|nr:Pls/PosA family non-ribosomal peptide synthetase [Rhodococcus trifolii]GGG13613.1 hypothetical protein GCM10007304_29570 [Rhodococcus trifolii]